MYKPIARVDVDDIAFSSSLFSDKVDSTDELNQLQMDAFVCMVQAHGISALEALRNALYKFKSYLLTYLLTYLLQGSFLTHMYLLTTQ